MVGNSKRLTTAFEELKRRGLAHSQQDVANKMCVNKSNFSKAMNGEPSDNFLRRFNAAYNGLFSEKWLLTGEGDMFSHQISQTVNGDGNTSVAGNGNHVNSDLGKALEEISAQRRVTEKAQEQIDRLLSIIENMKK
ncbi:MAG: hypothetical protein IJ200_12840 [Prevotella sp.]|nr:hypothetical protein [Prevotella sp.]